MARKLEEWDMAQGLTQLVVHNAIKVPVTVYVVLGSTPGCLQDVSKIPWGITGSGLVGSFVLAGGKSTTPWSPSGVGFGGNFTFNTMPLNCPTEEFPMG